MVEDDKGRKCQLGIVQNIVVMAGRWICCINDTWKFEIDKSRMGISIDCSNIAGFSELEKVLLKEYNVDKMGMSVEIIYWDNNAVGELSTEPKKIYDDQGFVNFRSIQKGNKFVNLFVTFRETIDEEAHIADAPISRLGDLILRHDDSYDTSDTELVAQAEVFELEKGDTVHEENKDNHDYDYWNDLINTNYGEDVPYQESDKDDFVDPFLKESSEEKKFSDVGGKESGKWYQRTYERKDQEISETLKKCTKNIGDTYIYGFDDVEPMYNSMAKHSFSVDNFDLSGEDDEIYVGRLFNNKEEFKIVMAIYAIRRVFRFKISRFAKDYIVMQCIDQKCDWRVYAHQLGKSERYEVRKAELKHICSIESRGEFTKHATSKVVAALLRSKYGNITKGPRTRDLPEMVLAEHNVTVSYWKCWKARELAISEALGTEEKSYKILSLYLHLLKHANPGTICFLEKDVDASGIERFKYVFMSLGASIKSVEHLRRVVVMDGTHLHGKYKGCLLTASGQDANFQIFPTAFAIVDSENDMSWSWFLEKLKEIIDDGNDLVFVTDRQMSIYTAIESHYPLSHHGACLVHLGRNISSKFKGKFLVDMVTRAGEMFRVSAFKVLYEEIKLKDEECWKYLEKIGVTHWTRVYFPGMRYNLMSSNVAESINNALTPARDSPIVSLMEFIRRMLSRWFNTRRKKATSLSGEIPPEVEKILIKNLEDSVGLSVLPASDWHFEVLGKLGEKYHVDLQNMSCTCQVFDKLKIPCCHAIAAGGKHGLKSSSFVDDLYKKNRWAATYEGVILPVPDPEDLEIPIELKEETLLPPKTKRPSGRPPKKRM